MSVKVAMVFKKRYNATNELLNEYFRDECI